VHESGIPLRRRSKPARVTRVVKSALLITQSVDAAALTAERIISSGRTLHKQLEPLRAHFSEAALFQHRIAIEIRWLLALAQDPAIAEIQPFSKDTHQALARMIEAFSEEDAAQVKAIEAETTTTSRRSSTG